jgi:hypothetical protein
MKKFIALIILAAAPAALHAEQWQILGTRPLGMGGAFVAVAQGPIAQYWNPAGLAIASSKTVSGLEIPVTAGIVATGGILAKAGAIGDMSQEISDIKNAQSTSSSQLNPKEAAAYVKTMSLLAGLNKSGTGALVEANGGAEFKFSKVTVSVTNFTSVGLVPHIDPNNLNLGSSGSNLNFTGSAGSTSYGTAATDLKSALDALGTNGSASNAITLICGQGGDCGGVIHNNTDLANALINYAYSQSPTLTAADIEQAAATISQYGAGAGAFINGVVSGGPVSANQSNLTVDARSYTEIAAGYGRYFKFLDGLSMGANLKAINGRMASSTFDFMQNSNTGDAFKHMLNGASSSWQPAVDFGALWDVNQKYPKVPLSPKVGLVVRNINSPKFDRPALEGGTFTLDRQARMGVSFKPANFWNVAMDMDITKNKTEVPGFDSRQLALGTEFNLINKKSFNIPLRVGIMKNTAEKDSKLAYTAGTGIDLLYMHFDVGAAISSDRTTLNGNSIPTKATVSASFGLLF